MTGQAIFATLRNIQPIEGADRIVQANIYGETVIVSKDYAEGTKGILFDCETQLEHTFCHANNLYRNSELNEDTEKSGYIEDNRRVRPIRLKGVKCSGFFVPIEYLDYILSENEMEEIFVEGGQFDHIAGLEICRKYVVPRKHSGNKQGKTKKSLVPTFKEHFDTDQLMRNLNDIQEEDHLIITEKLHGTSSRCGYLPVVLPELSWWENFFITLVGFIVTGKWDWNQEPEYDYDFVVGSRKVVKQVGLEEQRIGEHKGYYDQDVWSETAYELFAGKLEKGETVYYEIVGQMGDGTYIMPTVSNLKLEKFMSKDEFNEFIDTYGQTTKFTYNEYWSLGVYVYRITLTTEDGHCVDYNWEQVKRRCAQLGVKHVPELAKGKMYEFAKEQCVVDPECDGRKTLRYEEKRKELFAQYIEAVAADESEIFNTHIREGVCVRIENGALTPKIFKHKSFVFKVLEGIIKDEGQTDLEESQG